MERANEVLPMAGRPAMMTRSLFCQPEVMLSSPVYPDGIPVRPLVCDDAFCNISMACRSTGSICV